MTKAEAEPCAITEAANTCSSGDGNPLYIGTMCYDCYIKAGGGPR